MWYRSVVFVFLLVSCVICGNVNVAKAADGNAGNQRAQSPLRMIKNQRILHTENRQLLNQSEKIQGPNEEHLMTSDGNVPNTQNTNLPNGLLENPSSNSNKSGGNVHSLSQIAPLDSTSHINETDTDKENADDDSNKDFMEMKDVCFPYLGCFSMGSPWRSVLRPFGAPLSPTRIGAKLIFYSRENINQPQTIVLYPEINIGGARFMPQKTTAIIVHGFSSSGEDSWLGEMKNAYLKNVDANVFIVDWGQGARLLNYIQVASNTRVVGRQLALFVNYLEEYHGAQPGKFHLIGHSLGAQICSYIAKEVPGIGRLTALDPAQPGFEGFKKEVRLDPSDAQFVDVIHTDAKPIFPTLGFGMILPHGHVDFYMNGGFDQPGCLPISNETTPKIENLLDLAKFPVEVIKTIVTCPHTRAHEYLIEALNDTTCTFWGQKINIVNTIKSVGNTVTQGLLKKFTGLAGNCTAKDCIPLGLATKDSSLRGTFTVTTSGKMPYCVPQETMPSEPNKENFLRKLVSG